MHLVSVDLDPNPRLFGMHLGPFSTGLNAICGPRGTGKTSLLTMARRLLFGQPTFSNATYLDAADRISMGERWLNDQEYCMGSVHAEDKEGHYRISAAAPSEMQRGGKIEFRPTHSDASLWRSNDFGRTPAWRSLAPEFYETLFATRLGTVPFDRLWKLARDLGVGQRTVRRQDARYDELRREEQELKDRLKRINYLNHDREWWINERNRVAQRLQEEDRRPVYEETNTWGDIQRLESLIDSLQSEIARLRGQEEDLLASIRDREEQLTAVEESSRRVVPDGLLILTRRQQLEEIDQRLYNWRQTLREIRQHRERIEQAAQDLRLERQLDFGHPHHTDPRWGLESLETQILNTRRHLNQLNARHEGVAERDRLLFEASLPATLQSMQDGLYEVCQQLSRNEAKIAGEKLANQIEQAKRCELELQSTIEKLIDERGVLLKQIADENQVPYDRLSLAVGDWCQCHEHPHLYQWLFGQQLSVSSQPNADVALRQSKLRSELQQLNDELHRTRTRLDDVLRQCHAYELELKELRAKSVTRTNTLVLTQAERQDLQRRLARADEALAMWDQHAVWSRRLSDVQAELRTRSPYRDEVQDTLVRQAQDYYRDLIGDSFASLPGWALDQPTADRPWMDRYQHEEVGYSGVPRSLAELAIRMAIADAIAPQFGRIPMILDDALEGMHGPALDRVIRCLVDYTKRGQQVLLATADEEVASRVRAHHGWVCHLKDIVRAKVAPPVEQRIVYDERPYRARPNYDAAEINRQLHAYANEQASTEWLPEIDRSVASIRPVVSTNPVARPVVGAGAPQQYFLSERSWIEEVPGVDQRFFAVLRRMGIQTVGDLLASNPREIAAQLQAFGVNEAAVRRWQGESELMCKVPQLRAFDARLLYGSGVTSHQQLALMHPGQLLQKVEAFLATDRGQEILRTGNSYELSRITTWIVSANRALRGPRSSDRQRNTTRTSPLQTARPIQNNDIEIDRHDRPHQARSAALHAVDDVEQIRNPIDRSRDYAERLARRERKLRERREREARAVRAARTDLARGPEPRADVRRDDAPRRENKARVVQMNANDSANVRGTRPNWRFYLEVDSPVVDAPSIGPRAAKELEAIGIHTVADLISRNADQIAQRMNDRKVTPAMVAAWQAQAKLVCCVPNLRGHDAQLLVAAGVNNVEQLVQSPAGELLAKVTRIAESKDGQRVLRGSKAPDHAEVADWLDWAKHSRTIRAA